MRRYLVVLCALALLLGSLPARAAGPAPVRLSPEARERFAAAMAFYRAGDWAQAAREFGEASAIAAPIAEYALLQQADSLARLGGLAGGGAAGCRPLAREPGGGPRAPPRRRAGLAHGGRRRGRRALAPLPRALPRSRRSFSRAPSHGAVARRRGTSHRGRDSLS